ncbi:hypothetical protein XENOCAPTIV_006617 [Xenoophorus captivus]|uniref:Ig-like domain-containing protein n=1 Tax=Xenoophorus captivus TaxID=1517983 RepID=A0ABV0RY12_9TELE
MSTAGADGSFEDPLKKPRGPRLISQLVLVWPQLHQSSTSPQVHQRKHHCTKCFSSQLLLCAVCVQVSVSSQSGANTWNKHCPTDLHLSVCVSTALAAMATQLSQKDLTLTRNIGETVSIGCDKVKPPEVNLYSVTSEYQQEKKQPLLCVASGMFPPVIQFSWRRQKENGPLEDLAPADGEHVELREAGHISSIWVVHQDPLYKYEYSCSVKHEGQVKEPQTKIGNECSEVQLDSALCFREQMTDNVFFCTSVVFPPPPPPTSGPHWFRERLLCLLYSVLISKSLIYFCGLSLFSICGNQRA